MCVRDEQDKTAEWGTHLACRVEISAGNSCDDNFSVQLYSQLRSSSPTRFKIVLSELTGNPAYLLNTMYNSAVFSHGVNIDASQAFSLFLSFAWTSSLFPRCPGLQRESPVPSWQDSGQGAEDCIKRKGRGKAIEG